VHKGLNAVGFMWRWKNYGEAHHIYIQSLTIHDVNGVDSVKPNGGINYTSVGDKKPSRLVIWHRE